MLLAGLVLVLLSTRNLFGLATVLLLGAGLYLAAHHTDGPTQDAVLIVIGWTLLLGSVRDTLPGFVDGLGDAHNLSQLTGFPALLWTSLFALGACAAACCAVWLTATRW
jgi:Peptidase M50B-like